MELKYNTYNKMPLKVFQKINELRTSELDAIDFEIALLSLLADCSENDILNLPISEWQRLRTSAQFLAEYPKDNMKCPDKIEINGHKYYLTKELDKITTAQYIDYQSYIKSDNNEHLLISCFLIPEGKTYGDKYNIAEVHKDILELDIVTCLSICFFFLNLYLNLISNTVHYLELTMTKQIKKTKDKEMKKKMKIALNQIHSITNGVGLT